MTTSHFSTQLLPGEHILWHGQPDKAAFARAERRLVNWVLGFVVAWAIIYTADLVSRHGAPSFLHGGWEIPAAPLFLALLVKFASICTSSRAGDYWYAVTDQRIFAEVPDEGSHDTIIVLLHDVKQVSLQQSGEALGTITIVTRTYYKRKVFFRDIADAATVYSLLNEITSRPASA